MQYIATFQTACGNFNKFAP